MALPVVAIVGRPNVGKSSLLNSLSGRMISIVDPTPGVTRDRVGAVCQVDDVYFELIDTGGYGVEDADRLTAHIEQQILYAIDAAGLVLFVVDVREGVATRCAVRPNTDAAERSCLTSSPTSLAASPAINPARPS